MNSRLSSLLCPYYKTGKILYWCIWAILAVGAAMCIFNTFHYFNFDFDAISQDFYYSNKDELFTSNEFTLALNATTVVVLLLSNIITSFCADRSTDVSQRTGATWRTTAIYFAIIVGLAVWFSYVTPMFHLGGAATSDFACRRGAIVPIFILPFAVFIAGLGTVINLFIASYANQDHGLGYILMAIILLFVILAFGAILFLLFFLSAW